MDREPAGLDPTTSHVTTAVMIYNNIYDTLLAFDTNMDIQPRLAESYERLDDVTYKFNLRKGVKFHNGEELKSSDVLFTFKRLYDIPAAQGQVSMIDPNGFECPDDYTFILRTKEPWSALPAQVCSSYMNILNEKAVTEAGEDYNRNPVGTGPFKFVSWTPGDSIVVERFDDYWGEKALLSKINFRIITENTSRVIDLESGGLDIALAVGVNDIKRLQNNPELELIQFTHTGIRYGAFNCSKEIFADKRVRQALNYATDVETIFNVLYEYGLGAMRANTPVIPLLSGRNTDLPQYEYNPEKAKALLAEAGYPDGFSVVYNYLANTTNTRLGEMLQAQWAEVGVELIMSPLESATLTAALNAGEHDFCTANSTYALGDTIEGLYSFFHSSMHGTSRCRAFLSNPEIDALLDEARVEQDEARREQLAYKIQELIHDEAPWIYIGYEYYNIGLKSDIKGFEPAPNSAHDFSRVYIEQ
ncbi:MAG: glutathione ABC transporter substrate-binding protein [Thermoanaerobacteraceae bacterium]|nr:glutathione ABC transporter substrate-binding protein [Thermoanaerobacteraceae bacterium]